MNPFEGIDIENAEIEELVACLTPLFTNLSIRAPIVNKGTKFFRARVVEGRVSNVSPRGHWRGEEANCPRGEVHSHE